MGHSASLKPHLVDHSAPPNKDATVDSAELVSKINDFFLAKFYGNLSLGVVSNIIATILVAISVYCWRRKGRRNHDRTLQGLEELLNRLERAQVDFTSGHPAGSSAAPSTGNEGSNLPSNDTTNGALQSATSSLAAPTTSSLAAPTTSYGGSNLSSKGTANEMAQSSIISVAPNTSAEESASTSSSRSKMSGKGDLRPRKKNGFIDNASGRLPSVKPIPREINSGSRVLQQWQIFKSPFKLFTNPFLRPPFEMLATLNKGSRTGTSSPSHGNPSSPEHGDEVVSTQMVFSSCTDRTIGDECKGDLEQGFGGPIKVDTMSSRILQTNLKLTEENLRALRNIAVKYMKIDKDFTIQFGGCYMYYCNGNPAEPLLLNLKGVKVPTVLQADYSAGILTIRGTYLRGAEFRAATSDGYMILKSITQSILQDKPKSNIIEVWKCTDPLPPIKLDEIKIFASKRVTIEGHAVIVRSEITPIENIFWRTVFRNWLPAGLLTVFLINLAWSLLGLFFNLVEDVLGRFCIVQLLLAAAIFIIQLLPTWVEDTVKDFMERLKLAYSCATKSFGLTCFYHAQWFLGAKHLVDSKFVVGGLSKQAGPSLINDKGQAGPSFGNETDQDVPDSLVDENRPDVTSEDWKWSCWRPLRKGGMEKFDPEDSNSVGQSSSSNLVNPSEPFAVMYISDSNYILRTERECGVQATATVRLYSKYLLGVIRKMLPTKLESHGTGYGDISAKALVEQLVFNPVPVDEGRSDSEETTEADREANRLHMRHLIRFLKKEYGDVIAQNERMKDAGVISFQMLWTLIVPSVELIYHCDITNEELCGTVTSTQYLDRDDRHYSYDKKDYNFLIMLEAYDYDCVDFGPKRVNRRIFDFYGEAKIVNMIAYPLRHKNKPDEAAAFFLKRGMKFCDLVLKHERRFVQYLGLLHKPPYEGRPGRRCYGNKESIDGRVMIDQGGFEKMKPNRDMGTARPLRRWSEGHRSRMNEDEIKAIEPLLKYAPASVFGFSFSSRKWGCFLVEGFTEIKFVKTAFDKALVMKEEMKKTLLTLSQYHIKGMEEKGDGNPDPLPSKGKACIILLYGPPGTGKTLTVETLAEKLECPLWQLSVSNLSASTKKLESKLLRKFDIAVSWRAILLLDEADVYLASRKYNLPGSEITRNNAMTGVFLRVLEYYEGLLFLTTNMVDYFEDAIFSRMSMLVEFKEFDEEDRKLLWTRSLKRVGFKIEELSPEFWKEILHVRFNGRVIRNVVQNAQIFARCDPIKPRPLSQDDLLVAFHAMVSPSARTYLIRHEDNYREEVLAHDLKTQSDLTTGLAPSVTAFSGPTPSVSTESSGYRRAFSIPSSVPE